MHCRDLRTSVVLAAALLLGQAQGASPLAAPSASDDLPIQAPVKAAYRCTSAQGTVSYSQQPCASGTGGRLVQVQDDRTEAQRRQAEANMRRDQAMAQEQAQDQARQARRQADLGVHPEPANLSGKVRQVAVGQREVDRRGAPTESLKHHPRHFRAKAPRKAARSPSSVAG
ncbi:DUF4124 domain-containing protein [Aquabacterium sp.]|jgi:hypothetical protein|uniref:DUF4124 domain-containing protein n=1 Tax=Aquabacterium sp. TaxID=1872578 RepID=UPI001DA8CEEB|nr:DUF4124 domain-containing protein [Aquabacterium sp.]MBT9610016.1 hypothetical protein [Aquabacterium sp.]|tara:strand:+ start:249 stop:761 length:513 start_codon:yes stop_codon:yes gene_type:complete